MLGHGQTMQAPVDLEEPPFARDSHTEHIFPACRVETAHGHVIHETQVDAQERQDAGLAIQQNPLLMRCPGLAGLQAPCTWRRLPIA